MAVLVALQAWMMAGVGGDTVPARAYGGALLSPLTLTATAAEALSAVVLEALLPPAPSCVGSVQLATASSYVVGFGGKGSVTPPAAAQPTAAQPAPTPHLLTRTFAFENGTTWDATLQPEFGTLHRGVHVVWECAESADSLASPWRRVEVVTVTQALTAGAAVVLSRTSVGEQPVNPVPPGVQEGASQPARTGAEARVGPDGEVALGQRWQGGQLGSGGGRWRADVRAMTFNVWNVNPPSWLWRGHVERVRQYVLRMYHVGDVMRRPQADIIALQEVRLDTVLAAGGPGHVREGVEVASLWYNRTRTISSMPRYHERNAPKWAAVVRSPSFAHWVQGHPYENPRRHQPGGAGGESATLPSQPASQQAPPKSDLRSPYEVNMPRGVPGGEDGAADAGTGVYPDFAARLMRAVHAQIDHVAAHLPGHEYVSHPGQLYVDEDAWWARAPQRDEEGPAIAAKGGRIVHWDYALLSRLADDEGDGHQRLCLHAVVDCTHLWKRVGEGGDEHPPPPLLVDVYTTHLALSEQARNRTVPELLSFVSGSARGQVQLLMGDMNAEPHEPAMRGLVDLDACMGVAQPATGEVGTPPTMSPPCTFTMGAAAARAVVDVRDGVTGSTTISTQLPRTYPDGALPRFIDTWLAAGHAEPVPGDADAATQRYAFTFPSDNPVKRIDMVYLATPPAPPPARRGRGAGSTVTARVQATFVVGQDPLPGTELHEGKGMGMVSPFSPVYASDHRAVVVDVEVEADTAVPEAA